MSFPIVNMKASDLRGALQQSKVQETGGNAGKAYLKFDYKTGEFLFGRDSEECTGDTLVVNVASFVHGWILWVGNQAKKSYAAFNQELPLPMEPVDGEQPSEARGFEARFEDDADTIVVFETSSYGGRKGVDNLLNQVKAKASTSDFFYPVVKLQNESYKAQKGGTIHNPVFEVVAWVNQEGQKEGEPAKGIEQAPAQAEQDEPEQSAQPARRRRVV